jgi:glycosyltransferase involved in cell wall biosynthesis
VVDGQTGCVVPPQNAQAIADAVDHILHSPEAVTAMTERGRQVVLAQYDVRRLNVELEAIFREVLVGQRN